MPKLSQRQIQGQNSRDKLLDVATRLFHENGYQAVTVNDICEAAQLTKGAFYHHFDSKETLYQHLYTPQLDGLPLRAFFNSRKCGRKNASALVSRRHPFFQRRNRTGNDLAERCRHAQPRHIPSLHGGANPYPSASAGAFPIAGGKNASMRRNRTRIDADLFLSDGWFSGEMGLGRKRLGF
ncbi:MAG: TetR/AcrR family transcriptional regulator [Christensenellales bacterium]